MSPSGSESDDVDRALIDPAAAFHAPQDVLCDARWPIGGKIEILCRWAYGSAELSVAEEEGMDGGESADLSAVLKALDQITEVDVQYCAPTKHAAFCVASRALAAGPAQKSADDSGRAAGHHGAP